MRMDDKFIIPAPRAAVWGSLIDPHVVGACFPGCVSVEIVSPTSYRATIEVVVGPIKTDFFLLVALKEQVDLEHIRTLTRGEGATASLVAAKTVVRLMAIDEASTEVQYTLDVAIGGPIGELVLGIFRKNAKSLAGQFAQDFRDAVLKRAALAQSA